MLYAMRTCAPPLVDVSGLAPLSSGIGVQRALVICCSAAGAWAAFACPPSLAGTLDSDLVVNTHYGQLSGGLQADEHGDNGAAATRSSAVGPVRGARREGWEGGARGEVRGCGAQGAVDVWGDGAAAPRSRPWSCRACSCRRLAASGVPPARPPRGGPRWRRLAPYRWAAPGGFLACRRRERICYHCIRAFGGQTSILGTRPPSTGQDSSTVAARRKRRTPVRRLRTAPRAWSEAQSMATSSGAQQQLPPHYGQPCRRQLATGLLNGHSIATKLQQPSRRTRLSLIDPVESATGPQSAKNSYG